jgi:hypothetical protein
MMNTMKTNFDSQKAHEMLENQELLSKEERDLCMQYFPEKAQEFLFHNSWNNTYLNLNVYSEVEKEAHDLSREMGI